jgi:hypothetical protein
MIYANEGGRERAVPSRYRGYLSGPTENSYTRRSQIGCLFQHLSGRFLSRWLGELQTKFLSGSPTGGQAPQVDRQAPSCSHNEPSFASFTEQSVAQLLDRRIVRLPAYQAPDHFDEGVTHYGVPASVNAALPSPTIAVVDTGAQSGITGYLPAVVKALPTADFQLERNPA